MKERNRKKEVTKVVKIGEKTEKRSIQEMTKGNEGKKKRTPRQKKKIKLFRYRQWYLFKKVRHRWSSG